MYKVIKDPKESSVMYVSQALNHPYIGIENRHSGRLFVQSLFDGRYGIVSKRFFHFSGEHESVFNTKQDLLEKCIEEKNQVFVFDTVAELIKWFAASPR